MKFIGRSDELNRINKLIKKDQLNVALIYGRRRIGKSELIKQALKDNESVCSIYYECKAVSERGNVDSLSEIISDRLNLPKLGYKNLEDLLKYVFELSKKEKIVLVLDEYSYLKDSIKGMDSIIQSLVDNYKDVSKLTLIISGSYVTIMKSLLEESNPLYGRVDLTIHLRQMDYYDSSKFYPNYSSEDKVKIYSVFGGIPYYNQLVDDSLSVKENIIELIASENARLENEVIMYLGSEIKKINNANETFDALARGFCRYSDILSQSHVSSGPTLMDVLNKLINMEIVEREVPINDEDSKKKAKYRICDNLSLFYYRYIFKHTSQLKIMNSDVFYRKYIEEDFEGIYVPHEFESICKQYLIRQNKKGLIEPAFEKIGKYYYDDPVNHINGEFDVVTLDENGYVFYESKFRKKAISNSMIEEEIKQVEKTNLKCYKYGFISKGGFSCKNEDNLILIDLNDLYLWLEIKLCHYDLLKWVDVDCVATNIFPGFTRGIYHHAKYSLTLILLWYRLFVSNLRHHQLW